MITYYSTDEPLLRTLNFHSYVNSTTHPKVYIHVVEYLTQTIRVYNNLKLV